MILTSREEFLKGIIAASALGLSGCLSFSIEDESLAHNVDFLKSGIIGQIKHIDIWNTHSGALTKTWMQLMPAAFLAVDFGSLIESECIIAYGTSDDHAPESSIVNVVYSNITVTWYDGNECTVKENVASGCRIIGTDGDLFISNENNEAPLYEGELVEDIAEGALLAVLAQKNPGCVKKFLMTESAKKGEKNV